MTQNGEKTPLYFSMQKIHSALSGISDYLLDLRYEESGYYTDLPVTESHIEPMDKGDTGRLADIKGDGKTSLVQSQRSSRQIRRTLRNFGKR